MERQQEWWTPAKAPTTAPKGSKAKRPGRQKQVLGTKGTYRVFGTKEEAAGAAYRAEMAQVQAPQPAAADTVHDTKGAAAAGPLPPLGLVAGGTTSSVFKN